MTATAIRWAEAITRRSAQTIRRPARTIARRLLDLTDRDRDLLLIGQTVIETASRLTRLEEQVADLRSRVDEFDLTPHQVPR